MGMNLINNRYKVVKILNKENFEDCLVEDSFDKSNLKFMRIIDGERNKDLVEFYVNEFLSLKNIRHKKIQDIEAFGRIETINLRANSLPLYYLIADINPTSSLEELDGDLSLQEIIEIIQELMYVVDYLHFRGFTYKNLNPRNVFYCENDGIKLSSLTSSIDSFHTRTINQFNEYFLAPSVLIGEEGNTFTADYYSIAMIMRYLLLKDYANDKSFSFLDKLRLKQKKRDLLTDLIRRLITAYENSEVLSLTDMVARLDLIADEKFLYDFKEDREHLYFKTKLIGREKELEFIDRIDRKIGNNTIDYNGLMITGPSGVGKSRLIKEAIFRFRMRGKDIFRVNVDKALSKDLDIIRVFLNIVTDNADKNILERYRADFIKFIPEKYNYDYDELYVNESSIQKLELYKLFNSICNYLKEISMKNHVYIMIDNINNYNEIFLSLIDYLLQSLYNSKVFIMFANNRFKEEISLSHRIKKWLNERSIRELALENLSKADVAVLTQNILGMSFTPRKFASVLYDSSKGNPRFLDLILKELYNNKQLYISKQGRWYSEEDNFADLSLPTDFRETMIKQTKDITGDKLKLLRLISVSKESLSKVIIYNSLDFEIKYLNSLLNSLLNEQILVESSYDNSYYYGFSSNELKVTVYHEIDDEEKKMLHRQLADILLEYRPEIITNLVEEISFHLIRADERDKAIELIVSKANELENIYLDRSVTLWEMAFSIVKDINHEMKIYILEKLTKINFHKSNDKDLQLYLEEFLKEAERINDIEYIVKAKGSYAEFYLRKNDRTKLQTVISDAEKLSRENNYLEGRIFNYLLNVLSLVKDSSSDRVYLKKMLDRALELSKNNNISDYLGNIYFQYGLYYDMNGDAEASIKYYEKSVKYLEANGEIYETIKAINNIGSVCLEQIGDKNKCFEYFEQGLEIANKYGFAHLESILLHNIGEAYLNVFEYKKAIYYTKKSIVMAQANKDIDLMIISNCNLGRIYLLTNSYDKAYEAYNLIKKIYISELVTDSQIIIAYRNFLGEFYFSFGEYDKAIKHSNMAKEMAKGFSLNFYFKSVMRLIQIDYLRGNVSEAKIYKILEEYNDEDISEIYFYNILILISIAVDKGDVKFAKKLFEYYRKLGISKKPDLIDDIDSIVEDFLSDDKSKLLELEEKLNEIENRKDYNVDISFYVYLAQKHKDLKEYKKSMRYSIMAFDMIYKAADTIDDFEIRISFIKKLNGERVKENINNIMKEFYGMNVWPLESEGISEDNFHKYFDLQAIIDSLTNKEINEIVMYQDDMGIESIDELISKQNEDYLNNINLILNYIGKETLAQRGFVLRYSDDRVNLEPIASLLENDRKLPNEMVIFQSLREEKGFLYNFNAQGHSHNRYSSYLPKDARGVICIPITSKKSHNSFNMANFYDMDKNIIRGYIYLETNNALNRFDLDSRKLIYSLSKLVALNLENENLRVNSRTDRLTSLYNRKYLEYKFEDILEESRQNEVDLSILMLDIDRFKVFNDKYGHLKGDEVLIQVADTIKTTVNTNGMVGRYGGEEFIVLLWDCDLSKSIEIGENIRTNIANATIPGIEDTITISVGLAQYPLHGSYKMELIDNADQALYYAKEVLSRNALAVWHENMEGSNKNFDKTRGLITGSIPEVNRNMLQLFDVAENIKEDKDIESKIYQFLGSIITITSCQNATLILYEDRQESKTYSRKKDLVDWVEAGHIHQNLVSQVFESKMGIFTVDWHDEFKDELNIPKWDSVLVVPIIKKNQVEGIMYATVPLKEKEFNQETLNVVNVFANIFSGNF